MTAVGTLRRRLLRRLRHFPERWSVHDWDRAYASGQLRYFGDVDELARYSLLAGYIRRRHRPDDVLDVGCGDGRLVDHLDPTAGGTYRGVDLSSEALHRAGTGRPEVSWMLGDFMEMDLEPADIVVLNEVLYFAPSADAMLDRAAGLLRPDGELLVSMWRHPGDRSLWRGLSRRFSVVDVVDVKNPASDLARRGWRVGCYGAQLPKRVAS